MGCIAVLDHNQRENERARRFVKRSEGQSLVRRALAYWVIKNAIARMLPVRPPLAARYDAHAAHMPYIPEKLPPVELPGLHFEDPRYPVRPLSASIMDLALG